MPDVILVTAPSDRVAIRSDLVLTNQSDFSCLFHLSPLGTMLTDADSRIVYVNPAFSHLTGYGVEEVIGLTPSILRSGRHGSEFYKAMWAAVKGSGSWQGEIWNRNKNGTIYPEMLTVNRLVDGQSGRVSYLGQFFDLTQKKINEELLAYEATHDLLTGLANNSFMRRHLDNALIQARTDLKSIAVLYIDLDGFKLVNDSLGHQQGDCVLRKFAQKLKANVRETDFVARVGGDEFVVVLDITGSDKDAAFEVAEKILASISAPQEDESSDTQVGCSIGISVFPSNGQSVNELLNAADMEMYKAKRQGGGHLYSLPGTGLNSGCDGKEYYLQGTCAKLQSF